MHLYDAIIQRRTGSQRTLPVSSGRRKDMEEDTRRTSTTEGTKRWRVIPFLFLMLAMLISGGISLAGVPTCAPVPPSAIVTWPMTAHSCGQVTSVEWTR